MRNPLIALLIFSAVCLLSACGPSSNFAPVSNGDSTDTSASLYRVQHDDTLYSIAFRFGLDYRKLAAANHISAPYHIVTGQKLLLLPEANDVLTSPAEKSAPVITGAAPATAVTSQPASAPSLPAAVSAPVNSTGPVGKWLWPASGRVVHTFSEAYGGEKGIDIAGKAGDPVKATAAGRVVYSGSGLRGYGLLLILKHNTEYLSAYAHNDKLLVKEGDVVKAGQTIALMGNTGTTQVLLHFEIRQAGKPVDPLKLLTPR
jgi:lipoprotein NlpD